MIILCPYDGKECWSSGCYFQHGQNKICTKQSFTIATDNTMTTTIITRPARCKDCKFLVDDPKHKTWHICGNPLSPEHKKPRTLKDRVCDVWELC